MVSKYQNAFVEVVILLIIDAQGLLIGRMHTILASTLSNLCGVGQVSLVFKIDSTFGLSHFYD